MENKYLTPEKVAERYRGQVSVGTLRNWRAMKLGSSFVKIGKAVLYPIDELEAERGARSMADHVRCYIHAAYSWGMKSDIDYRNASPHRFRIPFNPASGIPTEPKVQGTRWLSEDEFVLIYLWL